jgi:signal recognition particle GTPase
LTLISVDGQSLDLAYRQALSFFEKTGRIPNDEQEKATKYAASYLTNPKLWAAIKRAIRTELEKVKFTEDSEENKIANHIKARKIVDNIFVIPGSCGVGKTTMVGKVLYYL